MPVLAFNSVSRYKRLALAGVLLASGTSLSMGCAQQRTEGYYSPPAESTITDAQYQGQGAGYRHVVQAPSQLQIALKPGQPDQTPSTAQLAVQQGAATTEDGTPVPKATAANESAPAAQPRTTTEQSLVPQAQTYTGTLPCLAGTLQCAAQHITLTLAPNGRWRSRTAYLDGSGNKTQTATEQGCWDATAEHPPRMLIMDIQGNLRVELLMTANNVLRVKSVLGNTPNLNYSLTRQPDLDPIDELTQQATPKCL